ncbi:alpha-ketoglutarate-dependent 2,4-dichlorophenoxyacetate dioxygenase [Patellaria atrata CBS 101060]|uniref:Alpha-ketoglutarate-dependent 2,4-dichlorophenoxyacetate dioxygenase n=1 Tax=Patellaria atrata CBS 101060 TaxID=1346257 RepID=A0A9P4VJH3_9PEZI|nr:alpha-ketoglutarate-dependent 2,4-dichlorophenoxyacetate dioxygenase [Patellaria atrata CBS 101060]
MPGLVTEPEFKTLTVNELHPTFGAEVRGIDFEHISDEQFEEILKALAKYGVCVFRNTGLDDKSHVEFSRRFGELDDIKPYLVGGRKPRYDYVELFDAGNLDPENKILDRNHHRSHANRGNTIFHVDSSFNPRRASYSILRAVEIPPPETGGNTEFADSRTAFEELPEPLKTELLENDYVAAHSIAHSRKLGSPEFFKDLDPTAFPMSKHKLIQQHEESGRMNIYVAAHTHHLEGLPEAESSAMIKRLLEHTTQAKYVFTVPWNQPGDLVIWDNRCVLHRAAGGTFEGKYRRDLRRTTVHDGGSFAWGENPVGSERPGFNSEIKPVVAVAAGAS